MFQSYQDALNDFSEPIVSKSPKPVRDTKSLLRKYDCKSIAELDEYISYLESNQCEEDITL